MQPHSLLVTFY